MQGLQLSRLRLRGSMTAAELLLASKKIRSTPLRRAILEVLLEAGMPLSWKEAFFRLSRRTGADKVSLYRNLTLFESKGLIHKILGSDGAWRYCARQAEENRCPGNHAHFICLGCGRMVCLEDQPIPTVTLPEGFTVEGKQLLAYGRCSSCAVQG